MRWNCMSKVLRLVQITVEHQDCPFFIIFLTTKTSSQNISITLLQISLKLYEHRGRYWRKKLQWTILEEQFPVPRNTAASKIGNGVISLLWQLRCHCNPDHNKFSSLSNTTVVSIFPNLCLWRRSVRSNLGDIDLEKLYRAMLVFHSYSVFKYLPALNTEYSDADFNDFSDSWWPLKLYTKLFISPEDVFLLFKLPILSADGIQTL